MGWYTKNYNFNANTTQLREIERTLLNGKQIVKTFSDIGFGGIGRTHLINFDESHYIIRLVKESSFTNCNIEVAVISEDELRKISAGIEDTLSNKLVSCIR